MHGPAMSGWLLVALCVTAGAYCLARTRSSTGAGRRAAADEAVMGFGMAVMAVPSPSRWLWVPYAVVFGAASARALWSARGGSGHHLHHLVGSLAMVYMAVAMAGGGGGAHAAHGAAGGVPVVTGLLLAYYAVYVLRAGLGLVPAGAGVTVPTAGRRWDDPEMALACRVSMGLAMLAMLVTM
ncbi:DUF5134 domain-containing protein [Streptomyces sp. NPDC049837]|uniref:DUF5134 domain-containing protein n=1 Tax=Streptomyces sp. NPDC049837 TaxID=3155277 RepID=UPI003445A224